MPSALNSNYANWPEFSIGYNMYDFLTEELMPLIYGWFPASDKRGGQFHRRIIHGRPGAPAFTLSATRKICGLQPCSPPAPEISNCSRNGAGHVGAHTGQHQNAGGLEAYLASYENTWRIAGEKAKQGELPRLFCHREKRHVLRGLSWNSRNMRRKSAWTLNLKPLTLRPRMALSGPDHPARPGLLRPGRRGAGNPFLTLPVEKGGAAATARASAFPTPAHAVSGVLF